ncbi:hypothetical protein CRD60_04645 [Bifidobacterium aemilianum]|uniref:Uncharacterized protein n=1 Tax=Bifidobacterium aemilianum TaxID=2493120 RepID=A0A366K818_9BIFI|nr:hypothetical protein [Bifidobacterium aemilianum]RBP97876.1 hypothetical protein CRD60_04645 [Bifidobacterium aemilianum]
MRGNMSAYTPQTSSPEEAQAILQNTSPTAPAARGKIKRCKGGKAMVSARIPPDLRVEFKAACVRMDRPMEECMAEAMAQWLQTAE